MWSLVHFLSGYLLSGFFYALGVRFAWALVFSLILLLLWEGFEAISDIIEPSLNVKLDIPVGLAGFLIGSYFYYILSESFISANFLALLALNLLLAFWGFLSYIRHKARYNEDD